MMGFCRTDGGAGDLFGFADLLMGNPSLLSAHLPASPRASVVN
jgi:hypothetical protein